MNIPKQALIKLIATNIGSDVLEGVHWYNHFNDPALIRTLEEINQVIIGAGEKSENVFTINYCNNGQAVVLNERVCQALAKIMFEDLEISNKVKVKYSDTINIEESKKQEILEMVNFIKDKEDSNIDVFLYKMSGGRNKNIILTEGDAKYKMVIPGFRLTEEDISKVNYELAKYDKKIYTLEKKEIIDPFLGIRYSLNIGGADFV